MWFRLDLPMHLIYLFISFWGLAIFCVTLGMGPYVSPCIVKLLPWKGFGKRGRWGGSLGCNSIIMW
jgi:hypothetical protein